MMKNYCFELIERFKNNFEQNYNLKFLSPLNIGNTCTGLLTLNSDRDISEFIKIYDKYKFRYFILGAGTNTLISEDKINYIVVTLGENYRFINTNDQNRNYSIDISVGAKTAIPELLSYCTKNKLSGLEFMAGIPGTVGGAVYGNSGVKKKWIGSMVKNISGFENTGKKINITKKDLKFEYRKSNIDFLITSVCFTLKKEKLKNKITDKIKSFLALRKNQPKGYKSLGCVFKNPGKYSAGFLIEKSGLKGKKIGGCFVSEIHANFILNDGTGKFEDYIKLISVCKRKVFEKFSMKLEEEIKILK